MGTLRTARSGTMPCLDLWQYPRLRRLRPSRPASSGRRGGRPGARTVARRFVPSRAGARGGRVAGPTNEFARDVMGAVIENRDDGASRIERDGQSWFRVAVTPKTIMTSLGPVTYRRARYRSGASGASPVPVDESLGLVRLPDAAGGRARSLMMGARPGKRRRSFDAVGEHPAAPDPEHARMLGEPRPGDAGQHP